MLAARCVFLARMPIIMFVLVYRVVGCAILILVPMSVSHIMMIGFTLLPRTFAEYACCRFVEIIVTAGLVFCERLVGVVLFLEKIPLGAGSFVLCIGLCGLSSPGWRFVGMRIDL